MTDIRDFGIAEGKGVQEITLRNEAGAIAKVITWGAVVRDLIVPRADGKMQRVVLGLETLEDYLNHSPHFGAIAGRYANRIKEGRFLLEGRTYQLPLNQDNKHSLHGGGHGFGKRPWTLLDATATSVTLGLVSADGDAGYPGTLNVTCRYTLTEANALRVELSAFTDAPTIVNLCHHSYFNLDGSPDILDHTLLVDSELITAVDADLIPDGTLAPVAETPFDFRMPRTIRMTDGDGTRFWYDHNFLLRQVRKSWDRSHRINLAHAASLSSAASGLEMQVWTTEPCLQVYDGFKLNLPVKGLDGASYGANAGICLEPQHAPNSPNISYLDRTILHPGSLYLQVTEYRFSSQKEHIRNSRMNGPMTEEQFLAIYNNPPNNSEEAAAGSLLLVMQGISEGYYCSGWMGGLEFELWGVEQGFKYGMGTISARQAEMLRSLSEECDGWWMWPEEDLNGPVFVSRSEFQVIYDETMKKRTSSQGSDIN